MKKSIFILILAFIAGTTVFGQALPGSAPRPHDCAGDPEHPIAGNSYTYIADSDPSGGIYTFWATTDPNFISTAGGVTTTNIGTRLTTPSELLATSANYAIPDVADTVAITWSDAVLAATDPATSPTFVATYYEGPVCSDNFRVWSIEPLVAFSVDIKNIEDATGAILNYDEAEAQCIDSVRGATYNIGSSSMEYDFGFDTMYFEVVAANFTDGYMPYFQLTGLHAVQTAVIEWTYDDPTTWSGATTWNPEGDSVLTDQTNTSNGVSIYVRVAITNNNYEGNVDRDITLAVDGQNSVGTWDIVNNDPAQPGVPLCIPTSAADQFDLAVQTLSERPELIPIDPPAFEPGDAQN